jgi:hypothetical protein
MNKLLIFTTLTMFLILPILVTAKSETKIYKGYVVTNNGDRLIGNIEMLSPTLNEIKVKFIGKGNATRVLKAKEVQEYAFVIQKWNKENKQYEEIWITYARKKVERSPVPFGPTTVLLERQTSGAIHLYNHFVEQNTGKNSPYLHFKYIESKNFELTLITAENYVQILQKLTSDNPAIHNKIGTKGYGFEKIEQIVQEYNQCFFN